MNYKDMLALAVAIGSSLTAWGEVKTVSCDIKNTDYVCNLKDIFVTKNLPYDSIKATIHFTDRDAPPHPESVTLNNDRGRWSNILYDANTQNLTADLNYNGISMTSSENDYFTYSVLRAAPHQVKIEYSVWATNN